MMQNTGATNIILDTEIIPRSSEEGYIDSVFNSNELRKTSENLTVQYMLDPVGNESMATSDNFTRNGYCLVGKPSYETVQMIFRHYGYRIEEIDWPEICKNYEEEGLLGYFNGQRTTFLATLESHVKNHER